MSVPGSKMTFAGGAAARSTFVALVALSSISTSTGGIFASAADDPPLSLNSTQSTTSLGYSAPEWSPDLSDRNLGIEAQFSSEAISDTVRTDVYRSTLEAITELSFSWYDHEISGVLQFASPEDYHSRTILGIDPNTDATRCHIRTAMWSLDICTQRIARVGRWFKDDVCRMWNLAPARPVSFGELEYINSRFDATGPNVTGPVPAASKRQLNPAEEAANLTTSATTNSTGLRTLGSGRQSWGNVKARLTQFRDPIGELELYPLLWNAIIERSEIGPVDIVARHDFLYQPSRMRLSYWPEGRGGRMTFDNLIMGLRAIPQAMGTSLKECAFDIRRTSGTVVGRGELRLVNSMGFTFTPLTMEGNVTSVTR